MFTFLLALLATSTIQANGDVSQAVNHLSYLVEQLEQISEAEDYKHTPEEASLERRWGVGDMMEWMGFGDSDHSTQSFEDDDVSTPCSENGKPYMGLTTDGIKFQTGTPPFPCARWNEKPSRDGRLTLDDIAVIKAPVLGGRGYAGDGKFSENCNNMLRGRPLAAWNQPGGEGWAYYGGKDQPWEAQILEFAKQLATALNKLPDAKQKVFRGGWTKLEKVKKMQVGDIQQKFAFTSTSSDKSWAQGFAHDYHYPRKATGDGHEKEEGYVSTMTTITTCSAKDISEYNPKESELILLPNSKLKITKVSHEVNILFAGYDSKKVAKWLRKFDPPMLKSAEHVLKEGTDGNKILEAYVHGGFFAAQDLICGPENSGTNQECGYPQPKYKDVDDEEKSLYNMLRGKGVGKGEFAGMFNQTFANLGSAGKMSDVPSKVGKFWAIEMEEIC